MGGLAAASMAARPPAVGLPTDRASFTEIVERMHPVIPRMTSPVFAALAPTTSLDTLVKQTKFNVPGAPIDANGKAWSEYNHHWSGLIVLAAAILPLLSRLPKARWAPHWPLVFAGLAGFIVLRGDP